MAVFTLLCIDRGRGCMHMHSAWVNYEKCELLRGVWIGVGGFLFLSHHFHKFVTERESDQSSERDVGKQQKKQSSSLSACCVCKKTGPLMSCGHFPLRFPLNYFEYQQLFNCNSTNFFIFFKDFCTDTPICIL